MIMDNTNPSQVVLQIVAQNLDGSPKDTLASATVRVYHLLSGSEIEDLASTVLSHVSSSNVWRYIWEPSTLSKGHYFAEYTLTDSDNVTAVFNEDIIISTVCPDVEDIDDKLSDEHGDGSWTTGVATGKPRIIAGDGV